MHHPNLLGALALLLLGAVSTSAQDLSASAPPDTSPADTRHDRPGSADGSPAALFPDGTIALAPLAQVEPVFEVAHQGDDVVPFSSVLSPRYGDGDTEEGGKGGDPAARLPRDAVAPPAATQTIFLVETSGTATSRVPEAEAEAGAEEGVNSDLAPPCPSSSSSSSSSSVAGVETVQTGSLPTPPLNHTSFALWNGTNGANGTSATACGNGTGVGLGWAANGTANGTGWLPPTAQVHRYNSNNPANAAGLVNTGGAVGSARRLCVSGVGLGCVLHLLVVVVTAVIAL